MLVKPNGTHFEPASSWKDDLGRSQKFLYVLNMCLWTGCASTSILASRNLLVNSNFHYPTHLFFLQVIACIVFSNLYSWCLAAWAEPEEVESTQGSGLLHNFACLLMASSAAIFPHVVLHLPNISMLAMVSVRSSAIFPTLCLQLIKNVDPFPGHKEHSDFYRRRVKQL
jgi:hypothetical protein